MYYVYEYVLTYKLWTVFLKFVTVKGHDLQIRDSRGSSK